MPVELVEFVSIIVSLLTGILGVLSSTSVSANLAYRVLKRFQPKKLAGSDELTTLTVSTRAELREAIELAEVVHLATQGKAPDPKYVMAQQHLLKRLAEATALKKRMTIYSVVYHWSERFFTLTQYVVGGALTTSFAKQQLSPQFIGISGLIVVTVSALNQKLNPGANAQTASQQADQLDTLVHEIEDQMIVIQTTRTDDEDTKPLNDLSKKVTSEICKIKAISRRPQKLRNG
jgi:hypothetical protein